MQTGLAVALALTMLALTGCGGGETTVIEKTVVERDLAKTSPETETSPAIEREPKSLTAEDARFRTPSGNIVCSLSPEFAICEIFHKTYRPSVQQPADCPLDYGHRLSVDANGMASFVCYGDSMKGIEEGTLPYGNVLRRGPVSCLSRASGLTCTTRNGGGFFLSVQEARVIG